MTFGVSEQSGKSSIAIKAEEFGVALTKEQIEKVAKIHEQKIRLGYNYAGADASLYLLAINALSKKDYKLPYISSWQVKTCNENGKTTTSAKIVANQGKKIAEKRGSGDGPIDSLNIALSQVLKEFYPNLPQYKLTDYRVKIVNPEASTAAKVRVIIEFTDSEESWSTVGAHENIIEASWLALKDGAKYFLLRHNNQRPDF